MNWKEQLLRDLLEDQVPIKPGKQKTPLSVRLAKGVLATAAGAGLVAGGLHMKHRKDVGTSIPRFGRALQAAGKPDTVIKLPRKSNDTESTEGKTAK
jgi:hypothetical protein